jgi:uncharacterized protein (TIGR02246 family)
MEAMKRRSLWRVSTVSMGWCLVFLAVALAGCAKEKKTDPAALRLEIDAANKHLMETFARADAAGLAAIYTEDGQMLPPGSQTVEGRTAIEALWKGLFALPVKEFQVETRELLALDDDACEVGRYRLIGTDGSIFEAGKYVIIWRRGVGGWKIYRDIWNADVPAPTLPAAAGADTLR